MKNLTLKKEIFFSTLLKNNDDFFANQIIYKLKNSEALKINEEITFFIDEIASLSFTETETFLGNNPDLRPDPEKAGLFRIGKSNANFIFNSNKAEAGFLCSLDRLIYIECEAFQALKKLKEGSYSLFVKAVDKVGIEDKIPLEVKFSVDLTPPLCEVAEKYKIVYTSMEKVFPENFLNKETDIKEYRHAFNKEGITLEKWKPYVNQKALQESVDVSSSGNGSRFLWLQCRDHVGNATNEPVKVEIIYDETPPETGSIEVEDNKGFTKIKNPKIILQALNADYLRLAFSEKDLKKADWIPYITSYTGLDLSKGGEGEKKIWVEFKDSTSGYIQTTHASVTTNYDITPPRNVNLLIDGGVETLGKTQNLHLTFEGLNGKEIESFFVSETPGKPPVNPDSWEKYSENKANPKEYNVSFSSEEIGVKTIYFWFKDFAGNISEQMSQSLEVINPFFSNSWVEIPGGTFLMGTQTSNSSLPNYEQNTWPRELPAHTVTLSGFKMLKHEVTVEEYKVCVENGYCKLPSGNCIGTNNYNIPENNKHPMNCVSYTQAAEYCDWLGGGLPTEAEWEYAARGSDGRLFPWGNQIPSGTDIYANCADSVCHDGFPSTSPVMSFENGKSPFGIYDLAGNVWEWVYDYYSDTYYSTSPSTNPINDTYSPAMVFRGGGIANDDLFFLRTAFRNKMAPASLYDDIGIRCIQ